MHDRSLVIRLRVAEISGIGLISEAFLLDDGETGDTVARIGLHLESGIGDIMTTARTGTV